MNGRSDSAPTIVLFRRDLRVSDNAALAAAVDLGSVLALYILDEENENIRPMGAASRERSRPAP